VTGRVRYVPCPRCGAQVPWLPASRNRPFCSERCRTIDLGAWATERYRVQAAETDEAAEEPPPDDGAR
jgi:endogenous inhibitor of DNA gyrase (YacG/DUF329 family)